MVERGHIVLLDPEKYPRHAEIAIRLRRLPAWSEREPTLADSSTREAKPEVEDDTLTNDILPHQREVIERIKRNRELHPTRSEQ